MELSNVFDKFLKRKNIIIAAPLPDFNKSLNVISTNNSKIIIAVIGELSTIKGKEKVEKIKKYIQLKKLNMKVIVIGYTISDVNNLEYYRYSTINEFNDLITRYKPNIILETSIWPETYSYTLSLSMLTDLPILSLKKKFNGVISNRLLNYKKNIFLKQYLNLFLLLTNIVNNFYIPLNLKFIIIHFGMTIL